MATCTEKQLEEALNGADETLRALAEEVRRLRRAILDHKNKKGHELCWLNDVELWRALDPAASYPHETLPVRGEFLSQCAKYYESRLKGTDYEEPETRSRLCGDK